MADKFKDDDARVDEMLSLYEVEEPGEELADTILRKAAMYPREGKEKASIAAFFFAPIRALFFSKEYMPIAFSIVMFCLMVFVSFDERNRVHQNNEYNDYAHIMGIDDGVEIVAINRSIDDFTVDFENEVDYMVIVEMSDSFDI